MGNHRGQHEVEAETPEGTATVEITLAEGEQKSGIALALTMRGDVTGHIVDQETGAPVAGARLNVEGDSKVTRMSGDDRSRKSGDDGRFHLKGVLSGRWTLTVISPDPGSEPLSVPIEVQEGGGTSDAGTLRVPRRRDPQAP